MAMSKAEKNARRRELYALKKRTGAKRLPNKRDILTYSGPDPYDREHYPTVKHGARYGGEGFQLGKIGPHPGPFRKRRKGKSAEAKVAAPPQVRKRVARASGPKKSKRYGVLGGLIGPARPRGRPKKS